MSQRRVKVPVDSTGVAQKAGVTEGDHRGLQAHEALASAPGGPTDLTELLVPGPVPESQGGLPRGCRDADSRVASYVYEASEHGRELGQDVGSMWWIRLLPSSAGRDISPRVFVDVTQFALFRPRLLVSARRGKETQ